MPNDENSMNLEQSVFQDISTPSSCSHMIYRFAHDRVQQAAASLITEEQRKTAHGRIAEVSLSSHCVSLQAVYSMTKFRNCLLDLQRTPKIYRTTCSE